MEDSKQLILSINFETDEAMRRSAALRESIDADKAALQELNKTIKESGQATAEQALQREKLEHSIRENTRARSDENRSIDAYVKASKASFDATGKYSGSIKDMRAALSFLTNQWNELTREQRENADEGGKLQAHIKSLSDELKELEGSVGDNRRSVGGYLDAIKQAPGFMGKMRAGMQGLNGVMAANPVGALVQAFQLFLPLLQSSGEGADFFGEAMGMVNAIVQEGLKRLVALGGAAVKLFTGDFKGAFEQGSKALSGFSEAITKAVTEGGALARNLDELEERERAFGLAGAEAERQINKLLIQSRNRQTSEAERIKLLERAEKIELQRNKQEIALAQQRVKLIQDENKIKQEDADVQDERLKNAQANVIKLQQQTDSILEKIQVRKDALADAAEEKRKKREEEKRKQEEEAAAKELERLEDIEKKRKIALEETARFNEEVAALDNKAAEDKAETEAFLLSVDIANARKRQEQKDEDLKKELERKAKEKQAVAELATAGQALFAALAEENASFAEFEKALTLFRIGLASAEAITTGIAASQKAGPFPANLIAMATTVALVGTNLLKAKQLIEGDAPKPPKTKLADGGLLDGPSHAQGGIRGTGAFGNVEVEGGEAIINKRSTAMFSGILNAINIAGGGRALSPTGYAAAGGLVPASAFAPAGGSFMNPGTVTGIDYNELAKAMASQPIYVRPTEIVSQANKTNARKASTTIG